MGKIGQVGIYVCTCGRVLYSTLLYSTLLYSTLLYSILLLGTFDQYRTHLPYPTNRENWRGQPGASLRLASDIDNSTGYAR